MSRGIVSLLFVTFIAAAGFAQPGLAGSIAYDGFGPSFPIYANSGSGFAGASTQGGFNAFASGYAPRDRSLCYERLAIDGGSVSGGAFASINGAIRDLAQPLAPNGTVYVSFLVQPHGDLLEGAFSGFFGLTINGSVGQDLFIGKPGGGAVSQYVLEHHGGFGQVSTGAATVVGRTSLLVAKIEFMAGNDIVTLYVDPKPNRLESAATAIKSDIDLGNASRIGIYSTGAFTIDEIRIGTTYADVVPERKGNAGGDSAGCLQEPN